MNTRPVIDESSGPLSLSVNFNQDNSSFSVGTETGFCVFSADPCELKTSRDFNAGIGITELLGRYNFIALVGGGKSPKYAQNKVVVWDDHKQKEVVSVELKTSILRVRISKTRIIAVLQNSVHVYSFSPTPKKISSFDTSDNPLGLCCLGTKIFAFPGRSIGQIQLVEIESGNVSIVPAHASALRALEISADGSLLASASETGTLIRVFSTTNCAKIAELRRGVDPAFIFSISISPHSSMLAVTSDKSTLHLFDLPASSSTAYTKQNTASSSSEDPSNSSKWGILSKFPLLPRVFSDAYSFASVHFEIGDEFSGPSQSALSYLPALGSMPSRPQKGLIGWTNDETILVVGAGKDGRWERFRISEMATQGGELKRTVFRDGWKRYLGS